MAGPTRASSNSPASVSAYAARGAVHQADAEPLLHVAQPLAEARDGDAAARSRRGGNSGARYRYERIEVAEVEIASLFDILNKPFIIVQLIASSERAHISLVTTARISAADYEENHHGTAQTRQDRSIRLGHRPRLHGHVGLYGPADRSRSIATIHAALDAGITLLDTGDFYGMGHNEMLIGEALQAAQSRRSCRSASSSARCAIPTGLGSAIDARPAAVKNFVAYSLQRLGVDHIDIYRPARLDPDRADRGDRRRDRRHGEGRLCHATSGLSEVGSDTIRRAARRCIRSSTCRSNTRSIARGHRERHSRDLPRARHRHHRLRRAGARADQRTLVEGTLRARRIFVR